MESSQEVGQPKQPDEETHEKYPAIEGTVEETMSEYNEQEMISFPLPEWNTIHAEYNAMVAEIDNLKSALKVLYHDVEGYLNLFSPHINKSPQISFKLIKEKRESLAKRLGTLGPLIRQLQHEKLMELNKKEKKHD